MHEKSIQEWGKKWNYATDQALQSQSREHQFIEQIDRLQRELVLIEKTKRDMEEGFRWRLNESLVERMQELRRSSEAEAQRMKEELKDLYNQKLIQISKQREDDLELKAKLEADNVLLTERVQELEDEVLKNLEKIRDLELHLLQKQSIQKHELAEKELMKRESIIKSKEAYLQAREKQYEDTLEHNLTLQAEIRTYHKLLKAEENRLNLSSPPVSSRKRPKTTDSLEPFSDIKPHHQEPTIQVVTDNLSKNPIGTCTLM
jgi:hypothetical protein